MVLFREGCGSMGEPLDIRPKSGPHGLDTSPMLVGNFMLRVA